MRAAIYARVSTLDQEPENQLAELRRYVEARGWGEATEYVDHGISGARERRPALDRLVRDAAHPRGPRDYGLEELKKISDFLAVPR